MSVRPSGTEPLIRVMVEAEEGAEAVVQDHTCVPRRGKGPLYHPMLAQASMGAPAKGAWGSYQACWTEGNRKQGYELREGPPGGAA